MKKYYKGPIEVLKVTNLTISEQAPKILEERITLKEDTLFYQNRLGVVIRFDDKCPIATYEEMLAYMDKYISGQSPNGTYVSFPFFDRKKLVETEITKVEEKELIKRRRTQRKRTK